MATPMSAVFSAGASLTPSPVIATTAPLPCSAFTIRSLCSGLTRAYTEISLTVSASASLCILSSSEPVTARPSVAMPNSCAITAAVLGMIAGDHYRTDARAPFARATASLASSRGGSIIPIKPAKTRSRSTPLVHFVALPFHRQAANGRRSRAYAMPRRPVPRSPSRISAAALVGSMCRVSCRQAPASIASAARPVRPW